MESYKKLLAKTDEMVKAKFLTIKNEKYTNKLCKFVSGETPSTSHTEYYGRTIPWISTTAFGPNYFDENSAKDILTSLGVEKMQLTL